MEIACHASYPLNSENASPPGTFTVYLSCAEMAKPPNTASHTVVIPIVNMRVRFIQHLLQRTHGTVPGLVNQIDWTKVSAIRSYRGTRLSSRHTPMTTAGEFSLHALYVALDAQRCARGLSWRQATREINRDVERQAVHPVSASTITGTRTKAMAEGDGVLQMLLWLNR